MMADNGEFVLDPESTESVQLDQYDRAAIEEVLLHSVDEIVDEDAKEYYEQLARHVADG